MKSQTAILKSDVSVKVSSYNRALVVLCLRLQLEIAKCSRRSKTTATYKTWQIPLYLWKGDGNILCLIHSLHRQTPLATTQKPLQTNWAQQNVTTVSYKHYIHLQVGNTLSRIFRTIAERAGVAIEKKNTHIDNIVLEKRDAFQF